MYSHMMMTTNTTQNAVCHYNNMTQWYHFPHISMGGRFRLRNSHLMVFWLQLQTIVHKICRNNMRHTHTQTYLQIDNLNNFQECRIHILPTSRMDFIHENNRNFTSSLQICCMPTKSVCVKCVKVRHLNQNRNNNVRIWCVNQHLIWSH